MIDALFLGAFVVGLFAAWYGHRAARPLLASAALASLLGLLDVPFDLGLWIAIDIAVICAIEHAGKVREAEQAIIALFPPAWVFYHLQPEGWRDAVAVIVALQFLLTVPWDRLGEHVWKARTAR